MSEPAVRTVRVAIIGAGPAGFYAADHLLRHNEPAVEVDMYDRLPTPFGLVRGGVAPDHQKIKSVTRVFDKVAAHPRFRFFGNVEYGTHVTLEDLKRHYHQVYFSTGAQTDRSLGIPGEDLNGSHSATEFVAWYNGHPDFRNCVFDLSQERVAVIGVGNVAIDVARILARTPEELARTDIADYALEALRTSRVKEIYILGRRGPAQAAFTNPEVKELGEMEGADVVVDPADVALDDLSRAELEQAPDRTMLKNVEILEEFSKRTLSDKPRRLIFKFLVSPVEITGDGGHVSGLKLVHNELYRTEDGALKARATGRQEELPVDLAFRSVGYYGIALPDLPFDERGGVIPNRAGRVTDPATGEPLPGLYVGGWIKRGPTGVIGTNKPDAIETADAMLADAAGGITLGPAEPDAAAVERLVRERQPAYFSYQDWLKLDECERNAGAPLGRPRVKLTCLEDMQAALEQARASGNGTTVASAKSEKPKPAFAPPVKPRPPGAPARPAGL
jgi:ferredoxin/flavodoxin---NADP+ reductase